MGKQRDEIGFENKGIGAVLSQNNLKVPLNQREYSWEEKNINELFTDLGNAIASQTSYFLGTIVLTSGEDEIPEVSDGQQRLATISILIAAIRDYFQINGDKKRADGIENRYLKEIDINTTDNIPKFRLNVDDNEFFAKYIIAPPYDKQRNAVKPIKDSHHKIMKAAQLAKKHVEDITIQFSKVEHKKDRLLDWIKFIEGSAKVILLRVPDHLNAFMMFETLNDRGLKASQADLLKNYLLSLTGDRIKEGQQKWAQMQGTLESVDDEIVLTYIHHFLILKHGQTKERDIFDKVKETVNSKSQAIAFMDELADSSNDYVALFNAEHKKWNEYSSNTRKQITTINRDLRIDQIRPLMFAVSRYFSKRDASEAFKLFVFWTVRILVSGIRGGGKYDTAYSSAANQISSKKIINCKQLFEALEEVIPNDIQFEQAFSNFTTSKAYFARYLLRGLEMKKKGERDPEFYPSEDELAINLEHILPEHPNQDWKIDPDAAVFAFKKLGNMAIMQAKKNTLIGNSKFSDKKEIFKGSAYYLTREISSYEKWDVEEINKRQSKLAKLAIKTWPLH